MDTEVFLFPEACQDGVGQGTVSHLNRIPVPYQPGHVAADPPRGFLRIEVISCQTDQRLIVGNDEIHVAQVDEPVTMNAGHVPVHLGDDEGGLFRRCFDNVYADAEA